MHNGWFNIADELPTDGKQVDFFAAEWDEIFVGFRRGDRWFDETEPLPGGGCQEVVGVTHWRPRPPKPFDPGFSRGAIRPLSPEVELRFSLALPERRRKLDPAEQLSRQLEFLRRSCAAYDDGAEDEAVRIALIARILFRSTDRMASLLDQLEAYDIEMAAAGFRLPPLKAMSVAFLSSLTSYGYDSESAWTYPIYRNAKAPPTMLPRSQWWEGEPVLIVGETKVTRAELVCKTADQYGGAHVDPSVDRTLALLIEGLLEVTVTTADGQRVTHAIRDFHFAALRTIGYEILNSPALIALVRGMPE